MSYKTITDVGWWFWRSKFSLQRTHTPSRRSKFKNLSDDSRTNYNWSNSSTSYHTISWHQWNWNSDSFHSNGVVTCRGKYRYVEELHLNDPDNNPTSYELLLERCVAKGRELGSTDVEPSWSIEETHAKQLKIQTKPVYTYSEEGIDIEERKWNDTRACQHFRRHTFEAEVSKWVMRLVRRNDQHERGTDAVHWKSMGPKLRKTFQKAGGQNFSDSDWLQRIFKGSNKTRFQYCKNSRDVLLYIQATQRHTGGNMIAPELMGHVAVPFKWKEFLVYRGCSFDVTSILKSGLIAGGRESKEGRQTIFFTPLNLFGDNPDEEELSEDFCEMRTKVLQQATQNHRASGNRCEVLSHLF